MMMAYDSRRDSASFMKTHKQRIFTQVTPNFLAVAKLAWERLGYCHFPSRLLDLDEMSEATVGQSYFFISIYRCPIQQWRTHRF